MLLLASPYPATGSVVVVNQTSQLVDATLRPVPLSEVYGELRTGITISPRLWEVQRPRLWEVQRHRASIVLMQQLLCRLFEICIPSRLRFCCLHSVSLCCMYMPALSRGLQAGAWRAGHEI